MGTWEVVTPGQLKHVPSRLFHNSNIRNANLYISILLYLINTFQTNGGNRSQMGGNGPGGEIPRLKADQSNYPIPSDRLE